MVPEPNCSTASQGKGASVPTSPFAAQAAFCCEAATAATFRPASPRLSASPKDGCFLSPLASQQRPASEGDIIQPLLPSPAATASTAASCCLTSTSQPAIVLRSQNNLHSGSGSGEAEGLAAATAELRGHAAAAASTDTVAASCGVDSLKPLFHVMPVSGWGSDPNGPIFYKGRYHL